MNKRNTTKVAIIGGGITGLSAAYELTKRGILVKVFERGDKPGGLASGFREKDWKWSLEEYYHHIFTNDKEIISLSKKIGAKILILKPITASFIQGREIQLDSPVSVMKFKYLSVYDRLRMGLGLLILKLIPDGTFLERFTVARSLPYFLGNNAYKVVWEKLLRAKFGPFLPKVNMAWFWSRVAKRTKNLGYFEGGFQKFIEKLTKRIIENGGEIVINAEVSKIEKEKKGWKVGGEIFDKIIVTTPATIAEQLFKERIANFPKLDYLWGQTLILELDESLMQSYWLNILEYEWPFLVAVEHTNLIDKRNYNGKVLVYLGNYLASEDPRLGMDKETLFKLYLPFLKKINSKFEEEWVEKRWLFKSPFAQPVFPVNYSRQLPGFKTTLDGVWVANMSMVYPFDRGTNYAVKMGRDVAQEVLKELE